MYQCLIFIVVFHFMTVKQFIHSLVELWTVFVWTYCFPLILDNTQKWDFWVVWYVLIFTRDWQIGLQVIVQFTFLPAMYWSSGCSTFSGALHVGGHLNVSPYSDVWRYLSVILICISPMINNVLSILSCLYWPFFMSFWLSVQMCCTFFKLDRLINEL